MFILRKYVQSIIAPYLAAIGYTLNSMNNTLQTVVAGTSTPQLMNVPLGVVTGTVAIDCTVNRVFSATLGANVCTFVPAAANMAASAFITVMVHVTQDATGMRALGSTPTVKWSGSGYIPGLNSAPGSTADIVYTSFNGGQSWTASIVQQTMGS